MKKILGLLLILLMILSAAAAEEIQFGETVYIFPQEENIQSNFSLRVYGQAIDPDTFETFRQENLSGAVFGVYAKNADGEMIPMPDPENPVQNWILTTGNEPLSVQLPENVQLYLCLLQAPENYVKYSDAPEYQPISVPGDMEYPLCRAGMTGVYLTVCGSDGVAMQAAEFVLENEEGVRTLITDAQGRARAMDLTAGTYLLRQTQSVSGYSLMPEAMTVQLAENEARRLEIINAQNAQLALEIVGYTCEKNGEEKREKLSRVYDIYDESGLPVGSISGGENITLASQIEGKTYELRSQSTPADGFCADAQTHSVVLYPGQWQEVELEIESTDGYLNVLQTANETPVAGGVYRLEDANGQVVAEFEADAQGTYHSELLPQGVYVLRQMRAAQDCVYTGETLEVTVKPYLPEKAAPETVCVELKPLPVELTHPRVMAEEKQLPSLFDGQAQIDVSVFMAQSAGEYELRNLEIDLKDPRIPGVTVISAQQGEMTLMAAQRAYIPGAQAPESLQVEGTISYELGYPVSGGEMQYREVEEAFCVTAARFEEPLMPQAQIYGRIAWEDGTPAANIDVALRDDDGDVLVKTKTDAVGAYGFAMEEGNVQILPPKGFGALEAEDGVRLIQKTSVTGEVVLQGVAENTQVILSIKGASDIAMEGAGTFEFSGLIAEDAQITAQTPQGILYESTKLPDGSVQVILYPQAVVQGKVSLLDGSGVEGIEVINQHGQRAVTNADGVFRMEGLHPGEIALEAEIPDGLVEAQENEHRAQVSAGDTLQLDFVVMEPACVSGVVLNEGQPVAGEELILQPGGEKCITKEDGSFSFEGLRLGEYWISADLGEDAVLEGAAFRIESSAQRQNLEINAIIPASISGQVWEDADNDGFLVETEGGLSGAVVELLRENGETVCTVTTEKDGEFHFKTLTPGTYVIRVQLPDDMIFSKKTGSAERMIMGVDESSALSDAIVVHAGEKLEGLSVGAVESGTICGSVWLDENADGYLNEGEKAFEQATVSLIWQGNVLAQTKPDAQGKYSFDHIRLDNCQVQFDLPEGYLFTRQIYGDEQIGSNLPQTDEPKASRTAELRIWHRDDEINAGVVKAAQLEVEVWLDEDADGVWDSTEKPLENVEIKLYDAQGSVVRYHDQRLSDGQGKAMFASLRPNAYMLDVMEPGEEYAATTQSRFMLDLTQDTLLKCGWTKPGVISGCVFEDQDMDGLRGEGEPGESVQVELLNEAGEVIAQTVTYRSGEYAFEGVKAGTYQVRFTLEENQRFTHYQSSAPSYNSDVRRSEENVGTTNQVYLPMGAELHLDAGIYKTGSITGEVWIDEDDNARHFSNEVGMRGLEIRLLAGEEVFATTETDGEGNFTFDMLPPGEYRIRTEIPQAYYFARTGDMEGENERTGETDGISIDGNRRKIEIALVPAGSISGNTHKSGALVELIQDEEVLLSQTTDEDGNYTFDRVRPGKMTIRFIPTGEWTLENASDAQRELQVKPGEELSQINVRMIPGARVEGELYLDANWNGVKDADETGCANVRVVLSLLDENVQLETVSNAGGMYTFENLRPGAYEILCELPEGVRGEAEKAAFTLKEGENREMQARRTYYPAEIQGMVWEDVNGNGKWEEGEGLIQQAKAQALTADGTVLAEAETGEDGRYALRDLPPVECTLRLTLPKGYLMVDEWQQERTIKLDMDENWEHMDTAVLRSGRIGDTVWLDVNGNGLQDSGEPGMEGVEVSLWRVENGQKECVEKKTSDLNGRFRFSSVRPGKYVLSFSMVQGYGMTQQVKDFAEIDSNLKMQRDGLWWTDEVILLSNGSLLNMDAGMVEGEGASEAALEMNETEEIELTTSEPEEKVQVPFVRNEESDAEGVQQQEEETVIEDKKEEDEDEPFFF